MLLQNIDASQKRICDQLAAKIMTIAREREKVEQFDQRLIQEKEDREN